MKFHVLLLRINKNKMLCSELINNEVRNIKLCTCGKKKVVDRRITITTKPGILKLERQLLEK